MAQTKLLIWDWNGTLLDDVQLCLDILNQLLAKHGYPQHYDTVQYRQLFRFPIQDYYQDAGFDFSRHPYAGLSEEFMDLYVPGSESCPLTQGAKAALEGAQLQGISQVILSASPEQLLQQQVSQRGIREYFRQLLGLSDIYAKSKLEMGVEFMRRAGVDPAQAVMVGDSVHDFETAQAMGTRCVLCCAGHQCRQRLEETGAPVIDTLDQLLPLL